MSDLGSIPKVHEFNRSATADFAELECLRRDDRNVSALDVTRMYLRETDSSSEDTVEQHVSETFDELADRVRHSGPEDGRYPYQIDEGGRLLQLRGDVERGQLYSYLYLLLATRMSMKEERVQAGLDATKLFEEMCCEVGVRFWGGPNEHVRSFLFGTGRETDRMQNHQYVNKGRFRAAVNNLCKGIGEGLEFEGKTNTRVTARDGKLDVVVWRRFADNRAGQLIGFGQCKTGTYWRSDLMKLQPEGFCAKWMRQRPAVLPVRLYFVADRVIDSWYDTCVEGGILLDRCRILEYSENLPTTLVQRIGNWVRAAARSNGLQVP